MIHADHIDCQSQYVPRSYKIISTVAAVIAKQIGTSTDDN